MQSQKTDALLKSICSQLLNRAVHLSVSTYHAANIHAFLIDFFRIRFFGGVINTAPRIRVCVVCNVFRGIWSILPVHHHRDHGSSSR